MTILFPCPFCGSGHVVQVGGGRRFQHYQCSACSEVWTAQGKPEPTLADDRGRPPREAIAARDRKLR
jgi:hypothetical protein